MKRFVEQSGKKSILLTGASGQVGGELLGMLAQFGDITSPTRAEMDLADDANNFSNLRETIRTVHPRWIINAAAYNAVDQAEVDLPQAYKVNRDAIRAIGEEAYGIGAAVIHFSTDYVFDGQLGSAYVEADATGPLNEYGKSKLEGEFELAKSGCAHFIFRTSWVFGAHGHNFLKTILQRAREKDVLHVVSDQKGTPTWSKDLAAFTIRVMEHCEKQSGDGVLGSSVEKIGGLYHAAGSGDTTWFEFASEAVRLQKEREPGVRFADVQAISSSEYPTRAKRPANSSLNSDLMSNRFGWRMLGWRECLRKVIETM